MTLVFRFYFSPKRRVSRKGLWLGFILPYFAVSIVLLGLLESRIPTNSWDDPQIVANAISDSIILFSPFLGILLWVSLAVTFKRLHDRNLTGWWLFVPIGLIFIANAIVRFVPIVAAPNEIASRLSPVFLSLIMIGAMAVNLWLFVNLYFLAGTKGLNRFGPDPRVVFV